MAFPIITFDADAGLDGNDASGAGPATAVKGTKARTRQTVGGTRVGFFETSAPDLSLFAVDGSHALKLGTGGGRQWTKITAKKDTEQTTTGNISSGAAVLSALGSTTGMSVGDLLKVTGAGASGDMYSTILSVDSGTQVTLNDNAGTTVVGAAVTCPKQVTTQHSFTLAADTPWACGGKRGSINSLSQFVLDLLPGWTVRFENSSGQAYDFTAAWILTVAGDGTDGRITLEGVADPVRGKPKITATTAISPFTIRSALYRVKGFTCDEVDALVLVDSANFDDLVLEDLQGLNSVGITNLLRVTSAVTSGRVACRGFDARMGSSGEGILIAGEIKELLVEASFFYGGAPALAYGVKVTSGAPVRVVDSVFHRLAGGVDLGASSTIRRNVIERCTFDITAKGIAGAGHVAAWRGAVVRSNHFSNCSGTALEAAAGADQVLDVCNYNNFHSNNLNRSNVAAGTNDTTVDPEFRNVGGFDFRPGIDLRAKGYPSSVGGLTSTYVDQGAAQRREPAGGNLPSLFVGVVDRGAEYELQFAHLRGSAKGAQDTVRVLKSSIPTATDLSEDAIKEAGRAALRSSAVEDLVGQEVSA